MGAENPMRPNPIPRRSLLISFSVGAHYRVYLRTPVRFRVQCPSPRRKANVPGVEFGVRDAKLGQRFGRTAVPIRIERVADVAEVLYSHFAGPEAGRRKIAESVEEADARADSYRSAGGPGDVVQNLFPLSDAGVGE